MHFINHIMYPDVDDLKECSVAGNIISKNLHIKSTILQK